MGVLGSALKGAAGGASLGPWGAIGGGALGLIGGLFGHKSEQKQNEAQRQAAIAQLQLKNQMGEDSRLAGVNLGSSILGKIQSQPGSRVNYSGAIDPAVLAELQKRREYDFSKAVPDTNAGGGYGLLSGLFGGAGDLLGEASMGNPSASAPGSVPGGIAPTAQLIPSTKYKFSSLG